MSLSFCDTLIRSVGVRHHGQNFVLDKGAPLDIYHSYLHSLSSHIHLIKLGWTTWTLIDESEFCDKITLAHIRKNSNRFALPVTDIISL